MDTTLIPGSNYPEQYKCQQITGVPFGDELTIFAWVVQFDATTTEVPIPDYPQQGWLAAIAWDGGVAKVGNTPIRSCWGPGRMAFRRVRPAEIVTATSGMRVVFVGLMLAEEEPSFAAPVERLHSWPLESADYGTSLLEALFRVVKTATSGDPIGSDPWNRSALVVTTADGPQPVLSSGGMGAPKTILGLTAAAAPGTDSLSFREGTDDEAHALVLDFRCPVLDDGDGRGQGCSWRC